jgi:hypothetical protein
LPVSPGQGYEISCAAIVDFCGSAYCRIFHILFLETRLKQAISGIEKRLLSWQAEGDNSAK